MFLDPVEKVIALVHAGWKGTVLEIGKKTVQKMHQDFSCQPENILAAIGPSIGPCHYEVDAPVINQFKEKFSQWEKILTLKNNGKAQLNLWEANRLQLLDSGVRKDNITVSELCTYCHPEALYSYRFGNGRTGRLAGIIMLSQ
jgi:YfiH family protein